MSFYRGLCILNSVFDLAAGEVVGMTGGDFSPAGCIQYLISVWKRLWACLELIYDVLGH